MASNDASGEPSMSASVDSQTAVESKTPKTKSTADLMEDIKGMTDQELRTRLVAMGENVCPIGPSVRPLYEKKLLRYMTGEIVEKKQPEDKQVQSVQLDLPKPVDPLQLDELSQGTVFFSIAVLSDCECEFSADGRIFIKKEDALKIAKKLPGSRFKVFTSYAEALAFAQHPADIQVVKEAKDTPVVNESSTFRGPKIQELVKFRRAIELGHLDDVQNFIWSNPRFLISSGDTPVILQEGFRYNALHVASWKNRPDACRLILETLEDESFMQLLYPQDTEDVRAERITHICDLYLNMPDKGNMETPLHFACKYGHMEMVQVLARHPATDRQRKNKYGDVPGQVVCSRLKNPPMDTVNAIQDMLEGKALKSVGTILQKRMQATVEYPYNTVATYYVPLLRAVDNSSPAVVGEPYSPEATRVLPSKLGMLGQSSPKESPRAVRAYAGPMSPSQAKAFRRQWMTPPSPARRDVREYHTIRCSDSEKGLERIGRRVAQQLDIPWTEYWDFLGSFIDFRSPQGLQQLESYLAAKEQSLRTQHDLDNDIRKLEEKLSAFHVTSPPQNPEEAVRPQVPDFDWTGKDADDSIHEWLNNSVNEMTVSTNSSKMDTELIRKPVLWTDIGDIPPKKCDIHQDVCNCNSSSFISEDNPFAKPFGKRLNNNNKYHKDSEPLGHQGKSGPGKRSSASGESTDDVDSDKESEVFSYHTAVESPEYQSVAGNLDDVDPETPPEERLVFLDGLEPSKLDLDVLRALNHKAISPQIHPNITRWQHGVLAFSEQDRNSWKSPASKHHATERHDVRRSPHTPAQPIPGLEFKSPESPRLEEVQTNLMSSFMSV